MIEHVVVIFQENVSFDHYFGRYPNAANNNPNESSFEASRFTPNVNGLFSAGLLNKNPNSAQPKRLTRAQVLGSAARRGTIPNMPTTHAGRSVATLRFNFKVRRLSIWFSCRPFSVGWIIEADWQGRYTDLVRRFRVAAAGYESLKGV